MASSMTENAEIYVDRMSGRNGTSEAPETDLPFSERLAKYRTSESELSRANSVLANGPKPEDGSRLDIEDAAAILERSAGHHAYTLVGDELDQARSSGAVSDDEASQIYQRAAAHRMHLARQQIEASEQGRDGQSQSDDQGHDL